MGVLEEAIREHLELKRKHGASDEEVERKELEALGPARREFEAPADETSEEESHEGDLKPAEPVLEPAESEPTVLEEPAPGPPTPEPGFVEPAAPEAATRIHEEPIVEPRLTADDARDFAEDEDADEDEDEDERVAGQKPPPDFDFD
jgi:hypothetical protein